MMNTASETEAVRVWTATSFDDNPWTARAEHATVMIESGGHETLAILIDDGGSPRYYRIANDRVPSFIAAAIRRWSGASVAVIWDNSLELASKGGWPPPPPPPPPIKDHVLYAASLMAHHQMLAAVELAVRRAPPVAADCGRASLDQPGDPGDGA